MTRHSRSVPGSALRAIAALTTVAIAALPLVPPALAAQPPSLRPDVMGMQGALTSDHALATAAGADVLRRGGNAVDAAIAMAGVLTVVRPHMNGVGGDNFLLIRMAKTGKVYALNGSGRAGSRATPAFFAQKGMTHVPGSGILSVSVPGAVQAWDDALRRFGTTTLRQALQPAIRYAEQGFPVSTRLSLDIAAEVKKVAADSAMAHTFLVNGEAPAPGTLLVQRELGRTLRAIATGGARAFYQGATARRIADFMEHEGGLLTATDLANHRATWQEPISTTYLGKQVLAFPPNTQGATFLEMLNLAELSDLSAMGRTSADYVHTMVEGAKLVYADRDRYIADPAFADVPVARLISKEYARELGQRIRRDTIAASSAGDGTRDGNGDTVYLTVIDKDGNAVSMIQSLFASFGSGRMVPETGIVLHNRGALFSLEPSHPNIIAPGKRPFHTLSPAMALNEDGSLFATFGTPGGDGQPQTLIQILNNVLRFGMTPQQAVEAPRWRIFGGGRLGVEPGLGDEVRAELAHRGQRVTVQPPSAEFGGAQMIVIDPRSKARMVGSDYRREAYGLAW
ncbi:MAG TPA: gamma-glutamyltransferase [Gemmatimonadaceae bacterium]|nr:gamma-glutamyltransferase [Gemmatimonadaceae bacterium]